MASTPRPRSSAAAAAAPASAPTAADAAVSAAASAGVRVCFANPGTTEMFLVGALDRQSVAPPAQPMRAVLGLHEAVCTGAADGYYRVSRRPAMALLHLSVGLGNGLCNMHNARRARSAMVVVVGDMATWHRAADPPLNGDIEALARSQGPVLRVRGAAEAAATMSEAVARAVRPAAPDDHLGSVVTVVFPHDVSWQRLLPLPAAVAPPPPPPPPLPASLAEQQQQQPQQQESRRGALSSDPAAVEFLRRCAAAIFEAGRRGKAALLLGGAALLDESDDGGEGGSEGGGVVKGVGRPSALRSAGLLAAATGARAFADPLFPRADRGRGRPHLRRLPYFPQEAAAALAPFDAFLLVDARRPVAMFGYDNGPGQIIRAGVPDDAIWEVDASWGVDEALEILAREAQALAASAVVPGVSCGGVFVREDAAPPALPAPGGRLTPASLCQTVAALLPPHAIVVDEAITSGGPFWDAARSAAPFTHLTITGGAIGCGPPMALGAAVASPGRRVVNLQADGSGLYTLQALWSQAREGADVLTVVCANSAYAILNVESARQSVPGPASAAVAAGTLAASSGASAASAPVSAASALTSLSRPRVDWVSLAAGLGVAGARAETAGRLAELVREGLLRRGPFLIEAVL